MTLSSRRHEDVQTSRVRDIAHYLMPMTFVIPIRTVALLSVLVMLGSGAAESGHHYEREESTR